MTPRGGSSEREGTSGRLPGGVDGRDVGSGTSNGTATDRAGKRDRLARFYRVIHYLGAHPEGATVDAVAGFVGMSRRTVYRDLQALEGESSPRKWSRKFGSVANAITRPRPTRSVHSHTDSASRPGISGHR